MTGFGRCGRWLQGLTGGLPVCQAELIKNIDHSHPRMPSSNVWIVRYLGGIVDACVEGRKTRVFDVLHQKKVVLAAIE